MLPFRYRNIARNLKITIKQFDDKLFRFNLKNIATRKIFDIIQHTINEVVRYVLPNFLCTKFELSLFTCRQAIIIFFFYHFL